jgi:alpha-glucosidase (family GH31 glycosyl hydrolase)
MPSYFALGIFAGSQSQNWANETLVIDDLQNMITAKLPIEGILLDNYTKDGLQPYTIDTLEGGFGEVNTVHNLLKAN